ncbi:MAG: hypothetical protein MIO92_04145 [Methanosarcinaceae archaeon]|nr:hypothetical protein [Methanosarcinaceae archaeon]
MRAIQVKRSIRTTSGISRIQLPSIGAMIYPTLNRGSAQASMPNVMQILDALFDPSLKLIVEINYNAADAEQNYKLVRDKLSVLYGV